MSKLSDVLPIFVDDSVEEWKKHPRYPDLWVCNQGKFRRGDTLEDSKPLKVYDSKSNGGKSRSYMVLYHYSEETGPVYLTANKLVAEMFLPNPTGGSYDHVHCRDRSVEPPYRASNLIIGSSLVIGAAMSRSLSGKTYAPYSCTSLINSSYSLILANKLYKGEVKPQDAEEYLRQKMVEDGVKQYATAKEALAAGRQKGVERKRKRKKGGEAE